MTEHVLLDNVTHRDLRVNRVFAPGHGYDVNVVRVYPSELGRLQAEYPLFFMKNRDSGHFDPVALLGFEQGENLYLGGAEWRARYLPMGIERQPFLVGFQERPSDGGTQREPVVFVDLDHPSVGTSEGDPVFLPHGGETPLLERASAVLHAIHAGQDESRRLSQMLVGLELLESLSLEVKFEDGSKHTLTGLHALNEDRLRHLNADALGALHAKGHLVHVYMVLASLPNVATLVDWKNRALRERAARS